MSEPTPPAERPARAVDVCVVGGAGHVGLPLALVLASRGLSVRIQDRDARALDLIRSGRMPFEERGAPPLLEQALARGLLSFSSTPEGLSGVPVLIVTVGTPVDEFLNPDTRVMRRWADEALPHLADGQLVILRSTVYPGTTQWLQAHLEKAGQKVLLAYCPERIVQGFAVEELQELPQLVAGTTEEAGRRAAEVFGRIGAQVVPLEPLEAEFAKLFANAFRYIHFAIANQFLMIADGAGVDYGRVLAALKQDYPRARSIPGAGFTAGPCLLKDTMQLAAFARNNFPLGHAAMLVNEGLVLHLVDRLDSELGLEDRVVGLLGMAFKADCDDVRSSLSYKLKKVLELRAKGVLTTDAHVTTDPDLRPLAEVIEKSDVLVLCTPHSEYRDLDVQGKPLLDIWGFLGAGAEPGARAPSAG